MIKKLLLILFISISSFAFAQEGTLKDLVATPNPFSNNTMIKFNSSSNQNVIITIKNVLGKTVYRKMVRANEGNNAVPFEKRDLLSGIYIYAIQSNKDFISKRFVIK